MDATLTQLVQQIIDLVQENNSLRAQLEAARQQNVSKSDVAKAQEK